jgi:hypothetical protein
MVLPSEPAQGPRVRVVRDSQGRFIGFQDPDRGGRFISRADALSRLRYSTEEAAILDSFGNRVGVGALSIPGRGVGVAYKFKTVEYTPLSVDPQKFKPGTNQELIERTVFIDSEGNLVTSEMSYGLGTEFDPAKGGGRWRKAASEALGIPEQERRPTRELRRAVAYQQYIVKTIGQ